jgi:hypothetical protein
VLHDTTRIRLQVLQGNQILRKFHGHDHLKKVL